MSSNGHLRWVLWPVILGVLVIVLVVLLRPDPPPPVVSAPYAPSPTRVLGEIEYSASAVAGSRGCGFEGCHPDITRQWEGSAHHFSSFSNPFYRAATEALMDEPDGRRRARWCAGCHDPALLLTGNFDTDFDPEGPLATEGVGCLVCHAVSEDGDRLGNGGYTLRSLRPVPLAESRFGWLRKVGRTWLRLRPRAHAEMLLRPHHERAEFCLPCHKVSVDEPVNRYRWKRGQNEYDAWHRSAYSGNAARSFYLRDEVRTCVDCHMPEVESDDAGHEEGLVASHRFAAANTALPFLRDDLDQLHAVQAFLAGGFLEVEIAAIEDGAGTLRLVRPGISVGKEDGRVRLFVVVTNRGVGHAFPGGTLDSHEAWLRVRVRDASGRTLLLSGDLEPDGTVDPAARVYRLRMLDRDGRVLKRRDVQHWVATAYATSIAPGASDVARYPLELPRELEGPVTVEAELRYRKFNPALTRFVFADSLSAGGELPRLPVSTLDRTQVELAIGPVAEEPVAKDAPERERLGALANDLGIALLVQGDRARAAQAFAMVESLWSDRPDGAMNIARVALGDGDLAGARAALDRAIERVDEDHPTLDLLRGDLYWAEGAPEQAARDYERALAVTPEDRDLLLRLGRAEYHAGNVERALAVFTRILDIDPESVGAHQGRLQCLRRLGRSTEEAEAAVRRYKELEQERAIAGRWLRENPVENMHAQPMWESTLPGENR